MWPPGDGAAGRSRECPAGHELQPWTAPAGTCDGCGKRFPNGEQVMDCRRCEWLLCEVCCPRAGVESSLWGTISQLPFYAVHRIEAAFDKVDEALDAFEERHASTFEAADKAFAAFGDRVEALADMAFNDTPSESEEERRGRSLSASPQQLEEAQALVSEFCEDYSESRVVPREEELNSFWTRCSLLYGCVLSSTPLATALAEQLNRETSEEAWQPQLRALLALAHLRLRGAVGREIAADVGRRARGGISRLADVPQCREEASNLLQALLDGQDGQSTHA